MAKFVVSEFIVEVGFKETVTQRLSQLETKVNQAASRIEKQLNGAFSRLNGAQKTGEMFKQIQRQADQTSNHIQKALQRGFSVGGIGGGLFTRYQQEGVAAANVVRDAMRNAANAGAPAGNNPRPYTPRPRQGFSGADSINDIVHRQQNSAFSGNMALRNAEQHSQYQARLTALRDQHLSSGADVNAFRRGLRELNYEFAQASRQASITRSQQRLAVAGGAEVGGVLGKLPGVAGALAVTFLSLQKTVEYFNESLVEGNKRAQARTMLQSAFSDNTKAVTDAVNDYANRFGADKATAQRTAAQLRFTLPEKQFSDTAIPQLLETESVFAHTTGMTADSVERFNYALSQIAASAKLMGQDWLQVINASPALIKPLQELTKTSDSRKLREYLQTLTGGEVAQKMIQAMEQLNEKTGAAEKAMKSMQATQGRLANAQKDGMEKFYDGYSDGFKNLLNAMTSFFGDNLDVFEAAGRVLGGFFNTLAGYMYTLDNIILISKAYLADLKDWWTEFFKSLPEPVQKGLSFVGDIITSFIKGVSEAALLYMGVGMAGKGVGLMARIAGLGGAGAAATGAGAAVGGGFLTAIIPTIVAAVAAYLATKPVADYIFDKAKSFSDKTYGEEKIAGGNLYKNSPLGRTYEWFREQFADVPDNWSQFRNAPLTPMSASSPPYAPPAQRVMVQLDEIKFSPLTLNIPLPGGQNYVTTVDVNNLIQSQNEVQMMSSQGLGGGWQIPGQNAGFSPSLLKR